MITIFESLNQCPTCRFATSPGLKVHGACAALRWNKAETMDSKKLKDCIPSEEDLYTSHPMLKCLKVARLTILPHSNKRPWTLSADEWAVPWLEKSSMRNGPLTLWKRQCKRWSSSLSFNSCREFEYHKSKLFFHWQLDLRRWNFTGLGNLYLAYYDQGPVWQLDSSGYQEGIRLFANGDWGSKNRLQKWSSSLRNHDHHEVLVSALTQKSQVKRMNYDPVDLINN